MNIKDWNSTGWMEADTQEEAERLISEQIEKIRHESEQLGWEAIKSASRGLEEKLTHDHFKELFQKSLNEPRVPEQHNIYMTPKQIESWMLAQWLRAHRPKLKGYQIREITGGDILSDLYDWANKNVEEQ